MPRFALLVALLFTPPLVAADDAKAALAAFKTERAAAAKTFTPPELAVADKLAARAEAALAEESPAIAARLIRDARWALPFRPADLPQNVGRVLGAGRLRHADRVNAVAYSPDGTKLASASRDGTVRVWDLGNGRELLVYRGHAEKAGEEKPADTNVFRAAGVAFSPDGKTIASCGGNEIHIWDAATGKLQHKLTGHQGQVRVVAWAGANVLLSGSDDKTVILWDVKEAKATLTTPPQTNRIEALAIAPGSKQAATVNASGELTVYSLPEGKPLLTVPVTDASQAGFGVAFAGTAGLITGGGDSKAKLTAPPAEGGTGGGAGATLRTYAGHSEKASVSEKINALAADAKLLVTAGTDKTVRVWDVTSGKLLWTFQGHLRSVSAVALRSDGLEAASGGEDGTIKLWSLNPTDDHRTATGANGPLWTVAANPDGSTFAAAGADRSIRIYDAASGKLVKTLTGHASAVTALVYLGSDRLASASGDKLVKVWDLSSGKATDLTGHTSAVLAVAVDEGGKLLVSGSVDKSVRGWNPANGKQLWLWEGKSAVCAVAVRPDGKRVAVGTADGGLTVLNVGPDQATMASTMSAHQAGTAAVAFTPDGAKVATCGGDGAIKLWNVPDSGSPLQAARFETPPREPGATPVSTVGFSADGRFLISGGADGLVRVWDVKSATEVRALRGASDWVTAAVFRPDGQGVVAVGVDKSARAFDLARPDPAAALGHALQVDAVAVSKDGKYAATASGDRTVKVWELATGREVAVLSGSTAGVAAVGFASPDTVVAAGNDQRVRWWTVTPPNETRAEILTGKQVMALATDAGRVVVVYPVTGKDDKEKEKYAGFEVFPADKSATYQVTDTGGDLSCAAVTADGTIGASGGASGTVRLWDLTKKARLQDDWPLFSNAVADLGLTPDKKTLVAIDVQGTVKIADVASRDVKKTFKAITGGVNALIMSPSGDRFATLSAEGEVKTWDLQGQELRAWKLPAPSPTAAFTPDGKKLITGNKDGTAYVLELP